MLREEVIFERLQNIIEIDKKIYNLYGYFIDTYKNDNINTITNIKLAEYKEEIDLILKNEKSPNNEFNFPLKFIDNEDSFEEDNDYFDEYDDEYDEEYDDEYDDEYDEEYDDEYDEKCDEDEQDINISLSDFSYIINKKLDTYIYYLKKYKKEEDKIYKLIDIDLENLKNYNEYSDILEKIYSNNYFGYHIKNRIDNRLLNLKNKNNFDYNFHNSLNIDRLYLFYNYLIPYDYLDYILSFRLKSIFEDEIIENKFIETKFKKNLYNILEHPSYLDDLDKKNTFQYERIQDAIDFYLGYSNAENKEERIRNISYFKTEISFLDNYSINNLLNIFENKFLKQGLIGYDDFNYIKYIIDDTVEQKNSIYYLTKKIK